MSGGIEPAMISPLIEHRAGMPFHQRTQRILRDNRHTEAGNQLVDAMVDFPVHMVGPARQNHNLPLFLPGLGNNLITLGLHLLAVLLQLCICLGGSFLDFLKANFIIQLLP
ncbi:hypothetical protein SDC9_187326 [bioreactor metagenome]|uniref:Uncharacterized protein n=1 Tax=bioreactor metagenome TaxID=1076179 RepID=A0A645HUG2_9ZZZZ